ncbi:MAG TPA: TIGR01777 family oxidoreductase, partial [Saprospiraceae bacterium]|nr:TIGR01777 family oxidoreductase [Saprospiraceae bacterium]
MSTVLLAGGSGLIGSRLAEMLREKGYAVRILTRSPDGGDQYAWNPSAGTLDDSALKDIDYIVNLAGTGIAGKRWTTARKRDIVESRVQSALTLRNALERTGLRPSAYLSASAIGYYGNSGERWMTEADAPVDDGFLSGCCRQWESVADGFAALGIRTVKFRIGVVLAREGGALAEFVKPLRFGIGGYFSDGQAWYSWIHRDDVSRFFIWAMENPGVEGVFNAVAPHPARNKDLLKAAAKAMRRAGIFVPAPAFALRLVLGEMSAVILNSNRVASEKSTKAGFEFQYPEL